MKRKAFLFALAFVLITATCCVGCVSKKNPTTNTNANQNLTNQTIYIRYANVKPTADADILPVGSFGPWLGISTITTDKAPTNYTAYSWAKIQGDNGLDGTPGKDGVDGADGSDGLSAYELYINNNPGASITEIEWLASLKGDPGKDGKDGNTSNALSIVSVGSNGTITANVNNGGASLYLIRAYCVVPNTPGKVTIDYYDCSACTSVAPYIPTISNTRYFIERGDINNPGEQVIIAIPVTPKFKNYFETGEFSIKVNGLNVEFVTAAEGQF